MKPQLSQEGSRIQDPAIAVVQEKNGVDDFISTGVRNLHEACRSLRTKLVFF